MLENLHKKLNNAQAEYNSALASFYKNFREYQKAVNEAKLKLEQLEEAIDSFLPPPKE